MVGGVRHEVVDVEHDLAIVVAGRTLRWTATVSSCRPWPHAFGLLGHRRFLDRFDVDLRGERRQFDVRSA